jgi:hypothetical protein
MFYKRELKKEKLFNKTPLLSHTLVVKNRHFARGPLIIKKAGREIIFLIYIKTSIMQT